MTEQAPMQVMDRADVIQWRKAERQRLIADPLAIPSDVRRRYAEQIAAQLARSLAKFVGELSAPIGPFAVSPTYVVSWIRFQAASLWSWSGQAQRC